MARETPGGSRAHAPAPDPRCDVATLRAFVAVARLGTVGGAARALGRTQPSISARLAALERVWGTRLFRRAARGMNLTPEGASLLPRAEAALRGLEELDLAAGIPVAASGALRVGAGDALGRRLVPRALSCLLQEFPAVEVEIREGPGPRLLDALREGEIDLALVVRGPEPLAGDGIDLRPLLTSGVHLLVPRGEPGLGEPGRSGRPGREPGPVDLKGLAGRRLVTLLPASGFRRHVEAAFRARDLPFRPAVEVGNLSLVRRFVEAGLGVAPVPAVAFGVRETGSRIVRRPLGGVEPVAYDRAVRAGGPLTPAARRFLELLGRSHGAD